MKENKNSIKYMQNVRSVCFSVVYIIVLVAISQIFSFSTIKNTFTLIIETAFAQEAGGEGGVGGTTGGVGGEGGVGGTTGTTGSEGGVGGTTGTTGSEGGVGGTTGGSEGGVGGTTGTTGSEGGVGGTTGSASVGDVGGITGIAAITGGVFGSTGGDLGGAGGGSSVGPVTPSVLPPIPPVVPPTPPVPPVPPVVPPVVPPGGGIGSGGSSSGGGSGSAGFSSRGGGSNSPRCELRVSDRNITRGQAVTFSWRNTRANEMTLIDDRGTVLIDSVRDVLINEDVDAVVFYPLRTTTVTLTAIRGSRETECPIRIVVQPNGISLSQIPYTGFEVGDILTYVFYTSGILWGCIILYFVVIRRRFARVVAK